MLSQISPWERLPPVRLCELVDVELRTHALPSLFAGQRIILIGVPGAFTPICTKNHIPRFVELAPSLKASGFQQIVCIAPDNPWVMAEWGKQVDPQGRIRFMSDGNLEFGRHAGLTVALPALFVGECLKRFVLISNNCVVEKLSVEKSVFDVTCTAASECIASCS